MSSSSPNSQLEGPKSSVDDHHDPTQLEHLPLDLASKSAKDSLASETSDFLDPTAFRRSTSSPFSQDGRLTPVSIRGLSPAPISLTRHQRLRQSASQFLERNRGAAMVALAQFFGATMNLFARLLELEGEGMHPMQVLFWRMLITAICCSLYMWRTKARDFPLGPKNIIWLLCVRALTGFIGIYCMWYSMLYLPLAEATVISFLSPSVAGFVCHILLHDPFTRVEQLASLLALAGVILIARPTSLFTGTSSVPETIASVELPANATTPISRLEHVATSAERLSAVGVALIGVLGAGGALSSIRAIGRRAHPLISVNYFSTWCTIVSTTTLSIAPLIDYDQPVFRFRAPESTRQWFFLLSLGLCGFIMQFLLTTGLSTEKSNRATSMIYCQMLFAAAFDKWVFGATMGWTSVTGCGLILGGAVWVTLAKTNIEKRKDEVDVEARGRSRTEAVPMLADAELHDAFPLEQIR